MRNTTSKDHCPMEQLAKCLSLEYDGNGDNRLFDEIINTASKDMNKKKYLAMEKQIKDFSVKGLGFEVYAWNDASGYDYWTKSREEDNYIMITVSVDDPLNLDVEQVKIGVEMAREQFSKYARYSEWR